MYSTGKASFSIKKQVTGAGCGSAGKDPGSVPSTRVTLLTPLVTLAPGNQCPLLTSMSTHAHAHSNTVI